jgi:hypothetical protein
MWELRNAWHLGGIDVERHGANRLLARQSRTFSFFLSMTRYTHLMKITVMSQLLASFDLRPSTTRNSAKRCNIRVGPRSDPVRRQ